MGGVEFGPGIDDGDDLCGFQVGESTVMLGCESNDVAFARDRLGSEKEG